MFPLGDAHRLFRKSCLYDTKKKKSLSSKRSWTHGGHKESAFERKSDDRINFQEREYCAIWIGEKKVVAELFCALKGRGSFYERSCDSPSGGKASCQTTPNPYRERNGSHPSRENARRPKARNGKKKKGSTFPLSEGKGDSAGRTLAMLRKRKREPPRRSEKPFRVVYSTRRRVKTHPAAKGNALPTHPCVRKRRGCRRTGEGISPD